MCHVRRPITSVSGVARDSARRVSEHMYCESVSASRRVKLRAACAKTSSTVSITPRSHSSAIDMKRRANFSCTDVRESYSITSRLNRSVSPINWNLSRHGFVALWLFFFCVFLVCLCFVCVCFGVFVCFGFLVFGFCSPFCSLERDKAFGLCIGPLPVYFCGHYSIGPCVNSIINLICNMLG